MAAKFLARVKTIMSEACAPLAEQCQPGPGTLQPQLDHLPQRPVCAEALAPTDLWGWREHHSDTKRCTTAPGA